MGQRNEVEQARRKLEQTLKIEFAAIPEKAVTHARTVTSIAGELVHRVSSSRRSTVSRFKFANSKSYIGRKSQAWSVVAMYLVSF